jgi:hypothetical protein
MFSDTAEAMLGASGELSKHAGALKSEVAGFLATVRAA